jgi:mannose-1-phosphate guanylyltransferase/phosphomannomutase
MRAVILAGGRGTRLEQVTHGAIPKPMAELMGRPVLEHIVRHLAECGFTELCCTLACHPEQIRGYFGDGRDFGVHLEYRQEDRPLGTAGAVKNCRDFTRGEDFLVISADAACDLDLAALRQAHRSARPAVTMALYHHDAPLAYGLAVTDRQGYVRSFIEKPPWERVVTDLVNTGIYILGDEAMAFVPEAAPFDFAQDLFPRLLAAGLPILGVPMEGYWRDIGDPGSYYRANLDAWEGTLRLPEPAPEQPAAGEGGGETVYACSVFWDTPRKARLMRAFTAGLMEAGADMSHGLTLSSVPGGVHIAPCADREAVRIQSDDPETVQRFRALAERLEGKMEGEGHPRA